MDHHRTLMVLLDLAPLMTIFTKAGSGATEAYGPSGWVCMHPGCHANPSNALEPPKAPHRCAQVRCLRDGLVAPSVEPLAWELYRADPLGSVFLPASVKS